MIVIVDYGLGNIKAFANAFKRLNVPFGIATDKEELQNATKIILPGVGAFDHAMQLLNQSGMRDTLDALVLQKQLPVLGICVGMQILAKSSEEGVLPGLGWINSTVKRFDPLQLPHQNYLPHMGWNNIEPVNEHPLLLGFSNQSRFYFLHSYYMECQYPEDTLANTRYGIEFCCAVGRNNVLGVQFHPEKSHDNGLLLLKNFSVL